MSGHIIIKMKYFISFLSSKICHQLPTNTHNNVEHKMARIVHFVGKILPTLRWLLNRGKYLPIFRSFQDSNGNMINVYVVPTLLINFSFVFKECVGREREFARCLPLNKFDLDSIY